MTTIAERLAKAMAHAGLNQTELERKAGLKEGYMSRPLAGERKRMDPQTLAKIAGACEVSFEWLVSGRGEMERDDVERPPRAEPEVPENALPVERELFRVMNPDKFEPTDFDAARRAIRETHFLLKDGVDLAAMAREWLTAAKQLRIEGHKVTTTAITTRVAIGRLPHALKSNEEASARLQAEADDAARALGTEPGAARHIGAAVAAAKRRQRPGAGD